MIKKTFQSFHGKRDDNPKFSLPQPCKKDQTLRGRYFKGMVFNSLMSLLACVNPNNLLWLGRELATYIYEKKASA